jgi:cytochrome b
VNSAEDQLQSGRSGSIAIWDLPIRLIHWSLVVLLPLMWWTAEENEFGWHMSLGIVMLGLLVFRVVWGFIGSSTARFSSFVRGPRSIAEYLRRSRAATPIVGHNPLGGWSVLVLLLLLISQVALGLIAGDPDDDATGPLNHLVSFTLAAQATEAHEWLFNVIIVFVVLHIGAVLFYLLARGDNLFGPMITGRKVFPLDIAQPAQAPRLRTIGCILATALVAWWIYLGAPLPSR